MRKRVQPVAMVTNFEAVDKSGENRGSRMDRNDDGVWPASSESGQLGGHSDVPARIM